MLGRPTLLLALSVALLLLLLQSPLAAGGRRKKSRPEVTCKAVKLDEICDGTNGGFRVFDGCNSCVCSSEPTQRLCSLRRCVVQDAVVGEREQRRANRFCTRLKSRIQRRLSKFRDRQSQAAAAGANANANQAAGGNGRRRNKNKVKDWPLRCFKPRRVCRRNPGATYFNGCNQCRCGAGRRATCSTNVCPPFRGTKRQFKRHCRRVAYVNPAPTQASFIRRLLRRL